MSTRETDVRMNGWCEGFIRQQRNDNARLHDNAREIRKSGEPWYICNSEFHSAIFAWHCVLSDRSPVLWCLSHGEGMDAIDDAVGINCKKGAIMLNIKAQVSSIWAKGCILMTGCVCYLT